jgi:hypothetical protein
MHAAMTATVIVIVHGQIVAFVHFHAVVSVMVMMMNAKGPPRWWSLLFFPPPPPLMLVVAGVGLQSKYRCGGAS